MCIRDSFLSEQNQKIFTPTAAAAATHTILAGFVVFACVHNKQ
jgi:hypothetical protein